MRDKKERWLQLCEQAAVEQDPERLLKLVDEISRMLDEKNKRVQQLSTSKSLSVTEAPSQRGFRCAGQTSADVPDEDSSVSR
jgi:hypothetical protein